LVLDAAAKAPNTLSRAGEKEKIDAVRNRYTVTDAELRFFIPFVIEATGSFGERARAFLKRMVDRIPCPAAELTDDGSSAQFHARILLSSKERIAAHVLGQAAIMADAYLRSRGLDFAAQ
jgi:hypothetical protein